MKLPRISQDVEVHISNDHWAIAEVVDVLSTQFTAIINGHLEFFFYKDEGDTWRYMRNGHN